MNRCECEHPIHFDAENTNAGQVHRYGALFSAQNMKTICTSEGRFHVCIDCEKQCLSKHEFPRRRADIYPMGGGK